VKDSEKLKIVLTILKGKRPTVTGLGAPIQILKDVIEELEKQEKNNHGRNDTQAVQHNS